MKLEDVPEGMEITWVPLDKLTAYQPDKDN